MHEKQVGAVNIRIDSDNFEIIDNELGDVGVDASLKITGELRRPKIEGRCDSTPARIEVDADPAALLRSVLRPRRCPRSCRRSARSRGSGSAEEATRAALRKAEAVGRSSWRRAGRQRRRRRRGGLFDAVELDVHARPCPTTSCCAARTCGRAARPAPALGDINITVGGDLHVRKSPGGQVTLLGTVETVRGTYEFQGRRFDLVRGGQIRFVGDTRDQSLPRRQRDAADSRTPASRRASTSPARAKAPELALSSNPPLEESDILALIVFNRPVNELGTGERSSLAATAGGIATGFIAAPLGESIGRALDLDLFEITTTTETGDLGAGVTLGQQIGDRAFVKLRQQFGERNITEFMLEYQLASSCAWRPPRRRKPAAPPTASTSAASSAAAST